MCSGMWLVELVSICGWHIANHRVNGGSARRASVVKMLNTRRENEGIYPLLCDHCSTGVDVWSFADAVTVSLVL